ncbi:recombinase family protein, partial [Desulfosarcina sp. OttesenSCG-928-G17]|nr:recombinase family protein [Desulfosarcina sp. OttesenSCG-928-G17]
MNPPKPRRAGVWIRVSTDEQAKGESPENHLKRAQMYCELQGWELAEIYDLSGVSGKTVIDHAEAKRMLSDISTGHITGLIFSRLARLARNTRELLSIADIFKQHGAALVSISENIDTSTPAGQLMYTLLGALAEWERAEISARVSASVPVRAALGKPTGGMGPWGYKWEDTTGGKRLAVDPEAAEKIRAIFQACVANDGNVLRTARYLNEIGLRTRRGASFSGTRLKRILTDESYIGRRRANYTKSTG